MNMWKTKTSGNPNSISDFAISLFKTISCSSSPLKNTLGRLLLLKQISLRLKIILYYIIFYTAAHIYLITKFIFYWLYVIIKSCTRFRVNLHPIVTWMSRNSLLETPCDIWYLSVSNEIRTHNHLVCKRTLKHLAKWLSVRLRTKWLWIRIPLLSLNFCFWITLVLLTLVHLELHFWK